MRLLIRHFRRHICHRTAKSCAFFYDLISIRVPFGIDFARPPEVTYLNHVVFVDEQVLRFQVPVNYLMLMHEVNTLHGLYPVPERVMLVESSVLGDALEQILLRDVLHDEILVLSILEICVKTDDVWVFELFVDSDLASKHLLHLRLLQALFVHLLDG